MMETTKTMPGRETVPHPGVIADPSAAGRPKRGLVLEGGAMRGLFSAGVIDVMMEHGMEFDGMVGVSAGAAFGCNYKSRQPGRVIRYNKRFAKDWRFCSVRSLILTGDIIGAEFAYHTMPCSLDIFDTATYENNPMVFYAVCTDVERGTPFYKRLDIVDDDTYDWIRASASMPMCSRIVNLDGGRYLDGGVADSIPLEFMERQGYSRNVVVLTQPEGFVKEPNKLMPLLGLMYRKYPGFVNALRYRHEMYNRQLDYVKAAEADDRAFVIRPPYKLPIGHLSHDPHLMQHIYDIGRSTAMAALPSLLKI